MNDGVKDVTKTWTDLKRAGFTDRYGNYDYIDSAKNKSKNYKNQICTNIADFEEKVKCADAKFESKAGKETDIEYRQQFALMDIQEACSTGKLCRKKDADDIPQEPNEICIKHEKCGVPGASLGDIYPDFIDYWKEIKDIFFGLKRTSTDTRARSKKDNTRRDKINKLEAEMRDLIKKYNDLPYPSSSDSENNNTNLNKSKKKTKKANKRQDENDLNSDSNNGTSIERLEKSFLKHLRSNEDINIFDRLVLPHSPNPSNPAAPALDRYGVRRLVNAPAAPAAATAATAPAANTAPTAPTSSNSPEGNDGQDVKELIKTINEKLEGWFKAWESRREAREELDCKEEDWVNKMEQKSKEAFNDDIKTGDIHCDMMAQLIKIDGIEQYFKNEADSSNNKSSKRILKIPLKSKVTKKYLEYNNPKSLKNFCQPTWSNTKSAAAVVDQVAYGAAWPIRVFGRVGRVALAGVTLGGSESVANEFSSRRPNDILKGINLDCVLLKKDEYGLDYVGLDKSSPQRCRCDTFVPTGIFQYDWIYFRKCFLNFKNMIVEAKNQDMKKIQILETFSKRFFMEKFYTNFGGDFKAYRDIMEEFSDKMNKICKLKRHVVLSQSLIMRQKINIFIDNYEKQLGEYRGEFRLTKVVSNVSKFFSTKSEKNKK